MTGALALALLLAAPSCSAPGKKPLPPKEQRGKGRIIDFPDPNITTFPKLLDHVWNDGGKEREVEAGSMLAELIPPGAVFRKLEWSESDTTDERSRAAYSIATSTSTAPRDISVGLAVLWTGRKTKAYLERRYALVTRDGKAVKALFVRDALDSNGGVVPGSETLSRPAPDSKDVEEFLAREREFYFEWKHRKRLPPHLAPR